MNVFRSGSACSIVIAAITAACFCGCSATAPTMKIDLALYPPEGAEVETTRSYQLVRWAVGDQQLSLSPRGALDDMLDLWLAIENQGEDAVTFFPSQIEYAYCQTAGARSGHAGQATTCTPFVPVPTEAQAAAHLAEREQKRQAADSADEAAMTAVLIIFVFALIIVVAAASQGGSSSGTSSGRSRSSVGHSRSPAFVPLRLFGEVAANAAYGRSYYEAPAAVSPAVFAGGSLKHAIREAVIAPAQHHSGHIFIPPSAHASLLRLRIGVGENTTTVDFAYKPHPTSIKATSRRRGIGSR